MSVSVQMSTPSLRQDKEERTPFLESRSSSRNNLSSEKGEVLTTDREGETCSSSKTTGRKKRSFMSNVSFFGVDLSPDNTALAMVYFVQGFLGLSRLAVSFYLKDDLHLDPADTAVVSGISALPWFSSLFMGLSVALSHFWVTEEGHTSFYQGLLGALSWTLVATLVDSKYTAAFCILLGSLSVAFSDVVRTISSSIYKITPLPTMYVLKFATYLLLSYIEFFTLLEASWYTSIFVSDFNYYCA